ncbi:unnamed protein product, partial [Meganyctiphanes norvegica]
LSEKMAAAGDAGGSGSTTNRIRHFAKINVQSSFFIAGACTECHKIPSEDVNIKACSNCRLVWYCGKECQKKNWTWHKVLCKATRSEAEEYGGPGSYYLETTWEVAVSQGINYV